MLGLGNRNLSTSVNYNTIDKGKHSFINRNKMELQRVAEVSGGRKSDLSTGKHSHTHSHTLPLPLPEPSNSLYAEQTNVKSSSEAERPRLRLALKIVGVIIGMLFIVMSQIVLLRFYFRGSGGSVSVSVAPAHAQRAHRRLDDPASPPSQRLCSGDSCDDLLHWEEIGDGYCNDHYSSDYFDKSNFGW